MRLYVVFDVIAKETDTIPFPAVNDGVAIRNFLTHLSSKEEQHKDDFQLYQIGTYDPQTMEIEPGITRIPLEDKPVEVTSDGE